MTEPILAAQRFAIGFALGAVLGLWYGFLRPLRPRHTILSDLLFLPGAVWVWLHYMFGICRGDLRVSAFFALALGCILWENTIGRFLRPVFAGLWHFASGIAGFLLLPCKKIFKNLLKKI